MKKGKKCRPQDQPRIDKIHNIWTRKWSTFDTFPGHGIEQYMKKILIYYPKNPPSLIPFTSNIAAELKHSLWRPKPKLKRSYRQILSRYKPGLIQSQNINLSSSGLPFWRPCRTSRAIMIYKTGKISQKAIDSLIKALKTNKRLRTLELGSLDQISNSLKYVRSPLTSLSIGSLSELSLENFKKMLFSSRFSLKDVTIMGSVGAFDSFECFEIIFQLPKLERFRFDGPFHFDVNRIPFMMLQKRNISYDIRLLNQTNEIRFSAENKIGLESLELLALNYKVTWLQRQTWSPLDYDYIEKQENVKSALSLNLHKGYITELSEVFSVCRNIKVLNITLAVREHDLVDVNYEGLRNLEKLEHLFIELSTIPDVQALLPPQARDLFENLKYSTKNLKAVSLHLYGEGDPQKCKKEMIDFFEACAEKVTQITFKVTCFTSATQKNTQIYYQALSKLTRVTSVKLIYEGFYFGGFEEHSNNYKNLLTGKTIEELYISSPTKCIGDNLVLIKEVKKLSINCWSLDSLFELCEKKTPTKNSLRQLELDTKITGKELWVKLLSTLNSFKNLEIFKLRLKSLDFDEESVVEDLKLLMRNHANLKMIACGLGNDPDFVYLFVKDNKFKYSEKDIEYFFGIGSEEPPKKRFQKKCLVQSKLA